MTRSKWKGPFVSPALLSKIKIYKNNQLKIASRNSEILPNFIGKSFKIHIGNFYKTLTISERMIGHKFGEFAFTRKRCVFKK